MTLTCSLLHGHVHYCMEEGNASHSSMLIVMQMKNRIRCVQELQVRVLSKDKQIAMKDLELSEKDREMAAEHEQLQSEVEVMEVIR